jgi:hypothetical protein
MVALMLETRLYSLCGLVLVDSEPFLDSSETDRELVISQTGRVIAGSLFTDDRARSFDRDVAVTLRMNVLFGFN